MVAAAVGVAVVAILLVRAGGKETPAQKLGAAPRTYETNDPIKRACALSDKILLRVWRGTEIGRSPQVTLVPQFPDFTGAFDLVNHSGPWDYLTTVPLVFYGPAVASSGQVTRPVNLVDG